MQVAVELKPVTVEAHRFAVTDFTMPDKDGLMKAPGRCIDCGIVMLVITDVVVQQVQQFAAREVCGNV